MSLNRFKIYWALALENPLYFLSAYLSAVATSYLLAMQPSFLRIFINEATRGVSKDHLLVIASFMLIALLLAFVFDTIQVTTSMIFKVSIEKRLRYLHYKFSQKREMKDASFPIQKGIFGLTEFTLMTSLEFLITLTNIIIVLTFIFSSNKMIGGIVGLMVLLLLVFAMPLIKRLGVISKNKEQIKNQCLSSFNTSTDVVFLKFLDQIQVKEKQRFFLETFLVFFSFFIFKVFPTIIIFYYVLSDTKNYGELASLFLYFAILHAPISKLMTIIKQSTSFFSQAEIFKDDIERSILIDRMIQSIPYGIVCIEGDNSNFNQIITKEKNIENSEKVIHFISNKKEEIEFSDFFINENLEIMTTPFYLSKR